MHRILHNLKSESQTACGFVFFGLVRPLERILPAGILYLVLFPAFYLRAAFNNVFAKPFPAGPLPSFFRTPEPLTTRIRLRADVYLNRVLFHFPDRLAQPKWRERCRIEGLHHLERTLQENRPVVLAFCHFGPYHLLHLWLRSFGLPAATFAGGASRDRSRLKRHQDQFWPRPELPAAFYPDQLREVAEFLRAGSVLLIAIDFSTGKLARVPFSPGWSFQMATGALRLAAKHEAELIPCTIVSEGGWRFRIRLGRSATAAPEPIGNSPENIGQRLLKEMRHDFESRPELCSSFLIRCLQNDTLDLGQSSP